MKKRLYNLRLITFWSYLSLLTYELLLKNPWIILGDKIASNPPLDTASVSASAVLHLSAFSVLGFLAAYAFSDKPEAIRVRYGLWLVAYCGVTEILQFCVPNRWPSGEDILFNVVGLLLGALFFYQPWRLLALSEPPTPDLTTPPLSPELSR